MRCEVCGADEAHPISIYNFAVNLCAIHDREMYEFMDQADNKIIWVEWWNARNAVLRQQYPSMTGFGDEPAADRFLEADTACRDRLRSWLRRANSDWMVSNATLAE